MNSVVLVKAPGQKSNKNYKIQDSFIPFLKLRKFPAHAIWAQLNAICSPVSN